MADPFARLLEQLPAELVDVEISGTDPVAAFRRYEQQLLEWLRRRYPGHPESDLRALRWEVIQSLGLEPSVWFDALSSATGSHVYRPLFPAGRPSWSGQPLRTSIAPKLSPDKPDRSVVTSEVWPERAAPAGPVHRVSNGLVARLE